MASFFPFLFGQQGTTVDPNQILVTANQSTRPEPVRPIYNDAPEREAIDPRYVLNDDRIAPTEDELKEIIPREGMFGVKGTLRDILGIVGDAFLVQSGNKPSYAPLRQRERAADAMFGFAENPVQAAERLAASGNLEAAQEVINSANQNDYRDASLASVEGARQDQARNRLRDDLDRGRDQVARWMQAAGNNEEAISFVYQLTDRLANELGVGIEDLLMGPNLSEAQRAVVAGGDMTTYQQESLPLRERQVATGERNADTASRRASTYDRTAGIRNPPPRPRADTETETALRIGNKPETQRTPAERDWYKRYMRNNSGGNGRRSVEPAPREGWGSVTREN